MILGILAHGSGIDEIGMVLGFPLVVGTGVWLLTRQKPEDSTDTTTAEGPIGDADS